MIEQKIQEKNRCVNHLMLYCILLIIRAELTAVHSSVLQQELDSCRVLLEEEPDNKCEYAEVL